MSTHHQFCSLIMGEYQSGRSVPLRRTTEVAATSFPGLRTRFVLVFLAVWEWRWSLLRRRLNVDIESSRNGHSAGLRNRLRVEGLPDAAELRAGAKEGNIITEAQSFQLA